MQSNLLRSVFVISECFARVHLKILHFPREVRNHEPKLLFIPMPCHFFQCYKPFLQATCQSSLPCLPRCLVHHQKSLVFSTQLKHETSFRAEKKFSCIFLKSNYPKIPCHKRPFPKLFPPHRSLVNAQLQKKGPSLEKQKRSLNHFQFDQEIIYWLFYLDPKQKAEKSSTYKRGFRQFWL